MWYSPMPEPVDRREAPVVKGIQKGSRWFLVREVSPGQGVIVRMESGDSRDYLRPEWRPGETLHWDVSETAGRIPAWGH